LSLPCFITITQCQRTRQVVKCYDPLPKKVVHLKRENLINWRKGKGGQKEEV